MTNITKAVLLAVVCTVLQMKATGLAASFNEVMAKANQLEQAGRFLDADALLTDALTNSVLDVDQRRQLDFARDRLVRILRDYNLTKDDLLQGLRRNIRGLTDTEFERWLQQGRFDFRLIDGTRWFARPSVSNLFFRYPALNSRRVSPPDTAAEQKSHLENARLIQAASRQTGKPYVLPKRFEVTMNVTVKPETAQPKTVIRAWLPVPRRYEFQDALVLLDSSAQVRHLAAPESPIRSAYLEQAADDKGGASFWIRYAYTTHGVSFHLDPARVPPKLQRTPDLQPFLSEGPHVVFSPEVRRLSNRIVGTEANPLKRAKSCYDWISRNIMYSYAPEYSTIPNLTEFCLARRYGDCGMETLLFITLCRLNGIPARWQSGWTLSPGAPNIHDWCELFIAPWGWIPVDPYMGIYATRYARNLSTAQRRELKDFCFGGLSQYRMIANADHCQELTPKKLAYRSDNVDFQRGELEASERNIYFDKFDYSLAWREIPVTSALSGLSAPHSQVPGSQSVRLIDFDSEPPGTVPSGWLPGLTGTGDPRWLVKNDDTAPTKPNVLAQSGTAAYPVCLYTNSMVVDGFVEVRFKPVSGQKDQAGGVLWRARDTNNYYVCRANALENNVVLYKTTNGKRRSLSPVDQPGAYGVKTPVTAGQWHMLCVEFDGPTFRVHYDGRHLYDVIDETITEPGCVGVWTKADSVTLFDDFRFGPL